MQFNLNKNKCETIIKQVIYALNLNKPSDYKGVLRIVGIWYINVDLK